MLCKKDIDTLSPIYPDVVLGDHGNSPEQLLQNRSGLGSA